MGELGVWPWKKLVLGMWLSFFFEFGSIASKQNLFSSMTFCQFWAANGVKSGPQAGKARPAGHDVHPRPVRQRAGPARCPGISPTMGNVILITDTRTIVFLRNLKSMHVWKWVREWCLTAICKTGRIL